MDKNGIGVEISEGSYERNNLKFVCDFHVDDILVARFFHTNELENVNVNEKIEFEDGREGLWVDINDDRISPWHQVALKFGWLKKNVTTKNSWVHSCASFTT